MSATSNPQPIVHFVGSIPLADAETVFRTLSAVAGPHLKRLPDGETGIRKTWIRFLQDVLADNPAIEVARMCRRSNSSSGTASCCARSRDFASSPAPRPIRRPSRPAMPDGDRIRGPSSTVCSRRA